MHDTAMAGMQQSIIDLFILQTIPPPVGLVMVFYKAVGREGHLK